MSRKSRDQAESQMRQMQSVLDDLVQPTTTTVPSQTQQFFTTDQQTNPETHAGIDCSHEQLQQQGGIALDCSSCLARGPTSPRYTLQVAKQRLQERGLNSESTTVLTPDWLSRPGALIETETRTHQSSSALRNVLKDPLWDITRSQAVHSIKQFTSGTGLMYPFVDAEHLVAETEALHVAVAYFTSNQTSGHPSSSTEQLIEHDLTVLKLVIAIGVVSEKNGPDRFADRLLRSMQEELWESIWGKTSLQALTQVLLLAIYHFHLDEEATAGRFTSVGARMCVELGLNRQRELLSSFPMEKERERAILSFWSAYTLDRRGSIGLGVPYILHDEEIDVSPPHSSFALAASAEAGVGVTDQGHILEMSRQYLISMCQFTKLSGNACKLVDNAGDMRLQVPCQELEYLDYQVLQWHMSIPSGLRIHEDDFKTLPTAKGTHTSALFLRIVLRARMNQLRNLIFRQILYSPSRILQYPEQARTAVQVAKESVLLLCSVNESTEFLRKHPVFFKHFLVSAFGLLLLAMVNAWDDLGRQIIPEFFMALNLFKGMSAESIVVMRYAAIIDGLEELAHKIGLPRDRSSESLGANDTGEYSQSVIYNDLQRDSATNPRASSGSKQMQPLNNEEAEMIDVRNEFVNFFDLDDGLASSLFDFPLGEMLLSDTCDL